MEKGESFGDVALRATKIRRTATVTCWDHTEFLVLDQYYYRKILLSIEA